MSTSPSLLDNHLEFLCSSLTVEECLAVVRTLTKIVQNALEHPGEERYRQLSLTNKTFSSKVWKHVSAQEFMLAIGWVKVDGSVVLPSDDLLPDALVALTKVQSLLDIPSQDDISPPASSVAPSVQPVVQPVPTSATSSSSTQTEREAYQERMRKMKEQMKLAENEKKRIAEQIKADRRETDQRKSKPSHSTRVGFGSQMTTFSDIGVDLNRGSG